MRGRRPGSRDSSGPGCRRVRVPTGARAPFHLKHVTLTAGHAQRGGRVRPGSFRRCQWQGTECLVERHCAVTGIRGGRHDDGPCRCRGSCGPADRHLVWCPRRWAAARASPAAGVTGPGTYPQSAAAGAHIEPPSRGPRPYGAALAVLPRVRFRLPGHGTHPGSVRGPWRRMVGPALRRRGTELRGDDLLGGRVLPSLRHLPDLSRHRGLQYLDDLPATSVSRSCQSAWTGRCCRSAGTWLT
jgi:hypothetical protein